MRLALVLRLQPQLRVPSPNLHPNAAVTTAERVHSHNHVCPAEHRLRPQRPGSGEDLCEGQQNGVGLSRASDTHAWTCKAEMVWQPKGTQKWSICQSRRIPEEKAEPPHG